MSTVCNYTNRLGKIDAKLLIIYNKSNHRVVNFLEIIFIGIAPDKKIAVTLRHVTAMIWRK